MKKALGVMVLAIWSVSTTSACPLCHILGTDTIYANLESDELSLQYAQAERDAAELAARFRTIDPNAGENSAKAKELSDLIAEKVKVAFQLRMEIQRRELHQIETALNASRERLLQRQKTSDAIIQRRVEDLKTGRDLSWLSPNSTGTEHPHSITATTDKGETNRSKPVSSYEMFLRDELGAAKSSRDGRLADVAQVQQALVAARNGLAKLKKLPALNDREKRERDVLDSNITTLNSQIRALKDEVDVSEQQVALLQKKILEVRQRESDFVAIKGTISVLDENQYRLSIGTKRGIEKGMRLNVFRDELFIDEIKVVEVADDSAMGVASNVDGSNDLRAGDVAILLLDPRLQEIIGVDPGEPIYNDKIRRFKFHMDRGVGDTANVGQRLMRSYFDDPNNPPIYGMWGDPINESLVVIAPAESEEGIREFLVRGEVIATTGFEVGDSDDSLESQQRELLRERRIVLIDIAHCKTEIIELESLEQRSQDQSEKFAEHQSELVSLNKKLEVVDRKLLALEELVNVFESGPGVSSRTSSLGGNAKAGQQTKKNSE